ncbi:pyruvate dehydrogenase (acetyl-transferring), homodimeric type, partial [bacterium]|nr:pyruvate dehydrogenase (acetyl-transferring), homodimeric type [bacterium]
PDATFYDEFLKNSGAGELSTTMAFVRILSKMLRHEMKSLVVPIIPDEGRTFGMEALFRQIGIYSPVGQLYTPVDSESLLSYREAVDGQILEEGINEVGSMSSWLAAGTAYATHGVPMIPFYIFYSMFGLQRVGDLFWLAGDIQAKGFLLGGTAGRTTLNGEGLQHQDGHSHLLASTIPNLITYDVAFRYEIAVILKDGLRRMYQDNEGVFYYITLGNENYTQPDMPEGAEDGILKGLYKFSTAPKNRHRIQLFGSGTIMREAIRAQELLARFGVAADIWGATNYKALRNDAIRAQRWNTLNPGKPKKRSYLETILEGVEGPFFAVSDNMRIVSDQIAPWVPGLISMGTDGFGRSESRENLRRFFEVDAECITVTVLYHLAESGKIKHSEVETAIKQLGIDPQKPFGYCV